MTQEEQIIERLNALGFEIKMHNSMRKDMMNLADVLTKKAVNPDTKMNHLMATIGILAFAVASLCKE